MHLGRALDDRKIPYCSSDAKGIVADTGRKVVCVELPPGLHTCAVNTVLKVCFEPQRE